MDKRTLQIECLVQGQTFETLWVYYSQSGGQLYGEECREMAIQFVESYENISRIDPRILDPKGLMLGENTDVADIVQHLKEWANGSTVSPYEDLFRAGFSCLH